MFINFRKIKLPLKAAFIISAGLFSVNALGSIDISQIPLSVRAESVPPLNMIVMGRDHTLYYEAYNDASDLNGDGDLNIGYDPNKVDYYGYFDSNLCYTYENNLFKASSEALTKKCTGTWSGDFLNYITTARVDALRKVLYGGNRAVDTATQTVLERSYIPQDAHSWGKEYRSIEHDGYDIRDYTPLDLPERGTRHLFANTTLLKDDVLAPNRQADMQPLMRVLTDSRFRIWEWVAIERHVAGSRCIHGGNNSNPCVYGATTATRSHANSHQDFLNMREKYADLKCGSGPIANGNINTSGSNNNPFIAPTFCDHDYYLTNIEGQFHAQQAGTYMFAVNGDDAVEFEINGIVVSHWYGGHGAASNLVTSLNNDSAVSMHVGSIELTSGWHDFTFRHEEQTGGDNWQLLVKRPNQTSWEIVPSSLLRASAENSNQAPTITTWSKNLTLPASVMTDYVVKVDVCNFPLLEENCKQYPDGNYKPIGLLQEFGQNDQMLFGLITGSYTHPYNMRGGVLRKNIESISNEIESGTGVFTNFSGIIDTISKLRIVDFDQGSNYQYGGGWLTDNPMSKSNRAFPDWGNPIAEMLYESLRYFSGKPKPTSNFSPTSIDDNKERVNLRQYSGTDHMFLPAPAWKDPFKISENTYRLWCTPSAQLVISDVNPSYDTEFLPGSYFNQNFVGDILGLNVNTEANKVWNLEYGGPSLHFIGVSGNVNDGVPSAKTVTGFGNIRGLSPAEPTKEGGYYSAAITHYAFNNDIRDDKPNKQNINTFAVALASPLPKIEIPVDGKIVTVIPFGKSVGQDSTSWASRDFQPTNTIVDFFVEKFEPDHYIFRINFEDVEQGADHDMDAIVRYDIKVNSNSTITITLDSEYAAGGIIHHMGYVISGTTNDGVYLEVRDRATSEANDPWFPMDTPPGFGIGDCAGVVKPSGCPEKPSLPLFAKRTFTPSNDTTATLLNDPLWYAAKYGSAGSEELSKGEPSPNYFLVTNASNLKQQLTAAFEAILVLGEPSTTAAAVSSGSLRTGTLAYSAGFRPEDWSGQLKAFNLNTNGTVGNLVWDAEAKLRELVNSNSTRNVFTTKIVTLNNSPVQQATPFVFDQLDDTQKAALNRALDNSTDNLGAQRVQWLLGNDLAHNSFRSRSLSGGSRLLGSIVNSDPQFMGKNNFGYSFLPDSSASSYNTYRSSTLYRSRPDVLFVGTNSGFLHAFNASSNPALGGKELFAYIPSELITPETTSGSAAKVNRLMDPEYRDTHRYMVDGTVAVSDAFFQAKDETAAKWRTVAVGTMGAGGRTVFALDVSDPNNFSSDNVLWEFTHPDLGFGVTHPQIGCIATKSGGSSSCTWAAIFNNGYNSASNSAMLFVVSLKDGTLIEKLVTGIGNATSPNGLSPVAISDWPNNDLTVNNVIAGDLQGNLWRFDLTGNQNSWNSDIHKIFTAVDPDSNPQPITSQILIASKPGSSSDIMLAFGTGSYFRSSDASTSHQVQSLYGITLTTSMSTIDKFEDLLKQEITWTDSETGFQSTSTNSVNASEIYQGWYLDLALDGVSDGERVINKPTIIPGIRRDRILFTSMAPSDDPCIGGVEGRYTDLMLVSGDRSLLSVFDIDNDGLIDDNDKYDGNVVSRITGGTHTGESATIISDEEGRAFALEGGLSEGDDLTKVLGTGQQFGRQSWQQLR